jgi:predicted dinucleotide-binding enzyme
LDVGIVGAGKIGGTLARRLKALGHKVSLANSRGPETLREQADEIGVQAESAREAAQDKDVVVVTIPERSVAELPQDLFAGVDDVVVVIDTGNYYPRQRDGRIDAIEQGTPESRWVEQQLGRPVVKAFNNMRFDHLLRNGRPAGAPDRIALPVSGDDARAKALVQTLVEELGFDAVDAGGLDESWRQQPGTPAYTADLDADGLRRALAEATPERTPEHRAGDQGPGS